MTTWLSYVDVLRARVEAAPYGIAFRFSDDGVGTREITYAELDTAARGVAAQLQAEQCRGERAVLLFAPGLDYVAAFFGCLYAGVIAVPAYPPMSQRQMPRLAALLTSAKPRFMLTGEAFLDFGRQMLAEADPAAHVRARWIATDVIPATDGDSWTPSHASPETIAFLQYTSGTTGRPKGVMVSHGNLLNNSEFICERFGHHAGSHGVIWLPPYHDMGLIGGILQPVYAGFPVTLMSPITFLRDPRLWLQAVTDNAATTSGGPNFAFDLCVRKIAPKRREGLDLSSWQVAFVGSETVRPATLHRFAEAFAPHGFRAEAFYPCYGLAEATLMVTGGLKEQTPVVRAFADGDLAAGTARASDAPDARALVSCGRPADDHQLEIVEPATKRRLPDGAVGEIWVRGPSVTSGYWTTSGPSKDAAEHLADEQTSEAYLRSGDIGFRLDGELFVTGRIKDVIVIRGRNYAPDDIELTVERCDSELRPGCGAAFGVDTDDGTVLFVAHEISSRAPLPAERARALVRAIRVAVTDAHGLAVHTVALLSRGTLPKTSSGKVQRSACRAGLLDGNIAPSFVDSLSGPAARHVGGAPENETAIRSASASVVYGVLLCLIGGWLGSAVRTFVYAAAGQVQGRWARSDPQSNQGGTA